MTVFENKKILLIDLHSFGSIKYYLTLIQYHKLRFELYEHFHKGSYSTRYYLAGPQGKMLLTIPVIHGARDRTPLRDIRIAYRDRWQMIHWRTLTSAYRRSPWFEFYEPELRGLYERPYEYLMDWNRDAFGLLSKWLGVSWDISFTDGYLPRYPEESMVDARPLVMPRAGREAMAQMPPLRYHQVFQDRTGFIPDLSLLDLLFAEGKRTLSRLEDPEGGNGE